MKDTDKKSQENTTWSLFQWPLFIMLPSNPTYSEISDINLFKILPNQCFSIDSVSDLILEQQPYREYDFIWFFPVNLKIIFLGNQHLCCLVPNVIEYSE